MAKLTITLDREVARAVFSLIGGALSVSSSHPKEMTPEAREEVREALIEAGGEFLRAFNEVDFPQGITPIGHGDN